jgi:hypothetical protein
MIPFETPPSQVNRFIHRHGCGRSESAGVGVLRVVSVVGLFCLLGGVLVSCTPDKKTAAPKAVTSTTSSGRPISEVTPTPTGDVEIGEDPASLDGVTPLVEIGDQFDDNISPIAVRNPNATEDVPPPILLPPPGPDGVIPTTLPSPRSTELVPLPPMGTSPAEREALTIVTVPWTGANPDDAKLAAGDPVIPTRPPLPTLAPVVTTAVPIITVPDLGLDAAQAEAILTRATWPSGINLQPSPDTDIGGNAFAAQFARDPNLRRSLKSGGSRFFTQPINNGLMFYVAGVVVFDPSKLGASATDEIVTSFSREGKTSVSTLDGNSYVIITRADGITEHIVVVKDRLVAAGAAATAQPKTLEILRALVAAAST